MKPFPVRRWHKPLQFFLGKDMHSPHVAFFNAQHTLPSDPSFHLSAQFNCSVVGFILCFSLYYFNDPLTESDWKNPINFSDTVGDVDGHKSACSLARNSSRHSQGKANCFKIWPTKTWRQLEPSPTEEGIKEAPQIGLCGPADRWFPTAFLAWPWQFLLEKHKTALPGTGARQFCRARTGGCSRNTRRREGKDSQLKHVFNQLDYSDGEMHVT